MKPTRVAHETGELASPLKSRGKLFSWRRTFGISAIIALIPLSTASGVFAATTQKSEKLESLGEAKSNDERSSELTAEAHSAERSESGSLLSVTWSVKNNGGEEVFLDWASGNSYIYSLEVYYSGVTVIPEDESSRYHPIMDGESNCLCSGKVSIDFKEKINPGEQVAYWSMYSVPEDVDTITLEIPGFEPIEDIPIS